MEEKLRQAFGVREGESIKLQGANGRDLNLICVNCDEEYDAWFEATEYLKSIAPVNREVAIRVIKEEKKRLEVALAKEGMSG